MRIILFFRLCFSGSSLFLSLLKYKGVEIFLSQKMKIPNKGNTLNNSIDKFKLKNYIKLKIKKCLIARDDASIYMVNCKVHP